ncbi:hypothetical protein FRC01_005692 [Tulasnella sp. 417]|nr:hypothetical protein FRC01_005692 [Tulasnella sp. 417]
MFLLHKKKERDKIKNYHPITLLNSDYKLQTKAMTNRLGKCVDNVIRPDQAGFVAVRDILDHIKLAKVVKEYCDTEEVNRCLFALHQEKAYDRIDHTYLWKILKAFKVPSPFLGMGDPLSCLLFDLAIELLAESLRRSNLKGIEIPGAVSRLLVRLFAEDTQVYLSKADKRTDVTNITDKWCLAWTAKFNTGKTEFLPMGSAEYRRDMARRKCLQPNRIRSAEVLLRGWRIVKDTEPIRILGGQVGHKLDVEAIWEPVTAKIESLANKWSAKRMTLRGKRLIVAFLLQSRAQYLMMTNDPPKSVVDRIAKATHRVMWERKRRGLTKIAILECPVAEGGQGVPDFRARVATARLMWLRKWCLPEDRRPLWAAIVDVLIRNAANLLKSDPKQAISSTLTQEWREKIGRTSKLSAELQTMLAEGRKVNVRIEGLKFNKRLRGDMPIWLSKVTDLTPKDEKTAAMKQLREHHRVLTMKDLKRVKYQNTKGCKRHLKCMMCIDLITIKTAPRANIRFQTPMLEGAEAPDGLDHTAHCKKQVLLDLKAGAEVLLNPDVTERESIAGSTRIFGLIPAKNLRTGKGLQWTKRQCFNSTQTDW